MTAPSLARLFSPRTVAVIGGREAESVIVEMDKLGFAGDIWPVNPRRPEMAGRSCVASVGELPQAPDCAYVAVSRDATIDVVAQLAQAGAGGAICHASGFSEVGDDGASMTERLLDAAGGMPILGPNCWGVLNLFERAALWPDFHGAEPVERGVAIVNQSGNMAINYTMQQRGLPLGMLVTLGNQAAIDANDCLEAFIDDDRITAIGLHIEGINDIARFSELAIRAHERGKPIAALKTGASAKAARAAISHTATLVGADALYDALFERYGIARAHSVPGFLETLKLLSVVGPLNGNRIASLSCSGGEASLIADSAEGHDLVFPDLTPQHTAEVQATLNQFVDVTNPLDYHTFIWGKPDQMTATFTAMLRGGFDLTALIIDFPRQDRSRFAEYGLAIDCWIEATRAAGAKTAIIATLPEGLPEPVAQKLVTAGIVPFAGMDEALAAIEAAARIGVCNSAASALTPVSPCPARPSTLDEHTAKQRLSEFGLLVPKCVTCSIDGAAQAAADLSFPVVVKALGEDLAHKSEHGAVHLNLGTPAEVQAAADVMRPISSQVLIEEMIVDGVAELIIGVDRDPQFGLHLVVGAGGLLVELLKDAATLLLPATEQDVLRALQSLKFWPLLEGYRGRPQGDIKAVTQAILNVQTFASAHANSLMELDINPLIVRPEGKGAVVVDALISLGD